MAAKNHIITPLSNESQGLVGDASDPPTGPTEEHDEKETLTTSTTITASQEPTVSDRLKDVADIALKFVANASNETLGACAVGLCASTYLVLGRVGLVLIGAVGGIVLHATWENHAQSDKDGTSTETARRRKELGLEIAKRVLDWRDKYNDRTDLERVDKIEVSTLMNELDFSSLPLATNEALNSLTDAIVRDYVKWWYTPLLPTEDRFPASCRQTLTSFILSFTNHISRRRTADPFLDFFANSTSIIIVFLNELATALKASPNQNVKDAINTYLEYSPDSSLANVLNEKQQQRKLNLVAEDILQTFLDSKTYNCGPARLFLREVLAGLILKAIVNNCSKAEWINGWIVYALEDGEPEIMNVIDAGVEDLGQGIKTAKDADQKSQVKKHQRRVSKAEEAMQQAMQEAQRLNEMIAEDEARRGRSEPSLEIGETVSSANTDAGVPTPSSSDSELPQNQQPVLDTSMVFDIEGNAMPSGANSPAKTSRVSSPIREKPQFTSFDQLTPTAIPTALQPTVTPPPPTEAMVAVPFTLTNATITILDMGSSSDKVALKQKPSEDMLLQIEPSSSRFPGWMVNKRYVDFEPLHETLRRIAVVSGIPEFAQLYTSVPEWKGLTRATLINALESYLNTALKLERLAESEAMKRFLEKDTGLDKMGVQNKNVLLQGAAALDNVGKGFINVLGQGGKGIAGGGKAVIGGVQGVFGGGPKKPPTHTRSSTTSLQRVSTSSSALAHVRQSVDLPRNSPDGMSSSRPSLISRPSGSSFENIAESSPVLPSAPSNESLHLPPPPSEMEDDFDPRTQKDLPARKSSIPENVLKPTTPAQSPRSGTVSTPFQEQVSRASSIAEISSQAKSPTPLSSSTKLNAKQDAPLTDEETRITVDLMFAIITSTYSLSSAWTIRLSLLSAAKTFLLRPNNPQLDSIRSLLQESLINSNTSDHAIAMHVNKLRENSCPTEEEQAKWPKPLTEKEQADLKAKARRLLCERGMPAALTSVMGQAASSESLGKVFDCLQVESVARGLMFALMLQAIRAAMQ